MKPVPVNLITQAIQTMLSNDSRIAGNATIKRSPLLNDNPSDCPWVGIYRANSQFEARALGYGAGARYQNTQLSIICQESDSEDPEAAEDSHETLVSVVLDILFSDPTLGGVVSTITLAGVNYQLIQNTDEQLLHSAELQITAQTTTR